MLGGVQRPTLPSLDPTLLQISKTFDGQAWQLNLTWGNGVAPYTVSYADDPAFQSGVKTLAKGVTSTGLAVPADATKEIEVFAVNDSQNVSAAEEVLGYQPIPAPSLPSLSSSEGWWGDYLTVTANYLDPIAKGNSLQMYDIPVRAASVGPATDFASSATFQIPDDARSFYVWVQAHGRTSPGSGAPFYRLVPRSVPTFLSIRGVSYASQTGRVWVAGDDSVQDADIFLHDPTHMTVVTGLTRPYISRVTADGRILYVDGVSGVPTVYQIDVTTHDVQPYAQTHDTGFTRDVNPVGLAVDPDGSACYVADANLGRVVKIPAGAGGASSTIKDNWGGIAFGFADPAGIDVGFAHDVYAASTNGYIYVLTGQSSGSATGYAGPDVHSIEVDRDSSGSAMTYLVFSATPARAEAFNRNPIGAGPARFHGATVFGLASGKLSVEPDWAFTVYRHSPQRVVLSNTVATESYPSKYQKADRIVELQLTGWAGIPVSLRVIDPPDLWAGAPDGGWPPPPPEPAPTPAPPYEANDNRRSDDYGLSTSLGGPFSPTIKATPGADNTLTFYLKVAPQYSGNNYQVEVTKCGPGSGHPPLPERVAGLSGVYSSWKRVFLERDAMFAKGGLLYRDYGSLQECGHPGQPVCCGTAGQPACNQIEAFNWQNATVGSHILIFDADHPAETKGETRTVTAIGPGIDPDSTLLTLDAPLLRSYRATNIDVTGPVFTNGKSAGYGVVSGCPPRLPVNTPTACYFDTDLSDAERLFNDGFVEVLGLRTGSGAIPYVAGATLDVGNVPRAAHFSKNWFLNGVFVGDYDTTPRNYFHLVGAASGEVSGFGWAPSDFCLVFPGWILSLSDCPSEEFVRWASNHELGHMFRVNTPCGGEAQHDDNAAWCAGAAASVCPVVVKCVMFVKDLPHPTDEWCVQVSDGIDRFCCINLLGQTGTSPPCGDAACAGEDGIRNHADPE